MTISVQKETIPSELQELVLTLAEEYPINFDGTGKTIFFEKIESGENRFSCRINDDNITVTYSGLSAAARGLSSALAGVECSESTPFKRLGIMLDVSRGMVMKVEHLKKWFRRLALSGYNVVMLYTEDVYELPDEPFFGRFRGAYSAEEIRELDSCAKKLGIELVGCIQTLGHMEQVLRWKTVYRNISDTAQELLAGEEKTYLLIEKMIRFWSENLTSRRIHIGMDETQDLGRGKYLNLNGYRNPFRIFNQHLRRVNEICRKEGLSPMIWSDMYFRFGNPDHQYYEWEKPLSKEVMAQVPENISLVYWDYYHTRQEVYENMIRRHREQGFEPIVASGLWTWPTLWYDHPHSIQTVPPCISACRKESVQELFFTMWGDDGAYCDFDSALLGIVNAAELSYGADEQLVAKRFEAICRADYAGAAAAAEFCNLLFNAALMIWDDPLMGIYFDEMVKRDGENFVPSAIRKCEELRSSIAPYLSECEAGNISHLNNILLLLQKKIEFRRDFKTAYAEKNPVLLNVIAEEKIPELIEHAKRFNRSFREQFLNCSKPFGLDRIQLRNGGLIARLEETILRIREFLCGTTKSIPELEQPDTGSLNNISTSYANISTGSVNRW